MIVSLREIAFARSGDKGGTANIGVAARHPSLFPALERELTEHRVYKYFSDRAQSVARYELPNLSALNFLVFGILGRGGTSTLRLDPQGKALADALLFMDVQLKPDEIDAYRDLTDAGESR